MRTYCKEFKEKALKLSDEIGVKHAAVQLGVPYYSLADWRCKRRHQLMNSLVPITAAEQTTQLEKLECENEELRKENEILKNALGILAIDRKK